jgi:hypothetical protein
MGGKKTWQKGNKKEEIKDQVLAQELLASTLSYLMLAPWWYTNHLNLSLWTPPMSNLVVLYLSSHYWFILPLQISASAGLRWICPNHLKQCCMSFSSTGATPSLSRMSSFWTRSLLLWPQIHRSMRISATLNCWICRLLVGQQLFPIQHSRSDRSAIEFNF